MLEVIRIGMENPTEFQLDFDRVVTAWRDGHWHLWILDRPFDSLNPEDKFSMDEIEEALDDPLLMLIFGESFEEKMKRQSIYPDASS